MDTQEAVAASTGAEDPTLAEAGDMKLLGRSIVGKTDSADRNSGDGIQAGTAPTVFDGSDFCCGFQYHGSGAIDRLHDRVLPPGRPGGHGLGMQLDYAVVDSADEVRGGLPRVSSFSLSVWHWYVPAGALSTGW